MRSRSTPNATADRRFDVLVWGATGVTGRLVCKQLAERYSDEVRWAIAGRNERKLQSLKEGLTQRCEKCKDVGIVVANAEDKASIDAMVQQAEVVIACAGPFSKYSDAVVESCVKQATHYVDITSFTRDGLPEAVEKGVKIVNFCGVAGAPVDAGAYFVVDYVKKRYGRHVSRVLACQEMKWFAKNPMSWGTMDSIINTISDAKQRQLLSDPFCLNPEGIRPTSKGLPDQLGPRYDGDFGFWTSPSATQVMKIMVHRSAALQPSHYGTSFTFTEGVIESSYWSALRSALSAGLFVLVLLFPPLRGLLKLLHLLPCPGEGPADEDEMKSWWKITFYALVEPDETTSEASPLVVRSHCSDNYGPYTSSARTVLECAMCLIQDKERLRELKLPMGGVMTPSCAFGNAIIKRFDAIGIHSDIL